ncbi:5-formyltetrahydrofolate cyclo-ligase [Vogesella indigofera]|uniref:5-formyltetrahydrofolate cyclo-ligase n=1 Tax=Vogesella indigofera TaxID=45465 RepID=UPI00234F1307|nr:5-formyltetrahydrofolate cyclo-ligase [Vogesella indigofera]MDC7702283.1 5-formyltetrahydrofolate cyclo-ligase [Vogesella indigofera]
MTSSAAADKARLRREIRQARKAIPAAQRHHAEQAISRHARRFFRHGRRIGAYVATGSELGLDALMARALAHGCRVSLPALPQRGRKMLFSVLDARGRWYHNRYGIPEFDGANWRARDLEILFVPLLAVDEQGYRMGQGGGFYDTTLAYLNGFRRWRRPLLVGVAFDCQRVAAVPKEAWDVQLDYLLTESGLIRYRRLAAPA